MSTERVIAGEASVKPDDGRVLAGESPAAASKGGVLAPDGSQTTGPAKPEAVKNTLQERIAAVDLRTGLQSLPEEFDEEGGDWKTITSKNPFEVLYLDYTQYKFITHDVIKQHYGLLEKFWRDKVGVMNSGGNRGQFKSKYGDGVVDGSLTTLKRAFEKIRTNEGIEAYYHQINGERLKEGETKLGPLLKMMLKDGEADPGEVENIIEDGLQYHLSREETAAIIKNLIDQNGLRPYGNPAGITLSETLLSVSWMTEEKRIKRRQEDEAKRNQGREIFDGVYAYSVEDIGKIIFENEGEAKKHIANGLLKNSIDYFSPAKAAQFLNIMGAQKSEHLRYLQIAYRLQPKLPYRFNAGTTVASVKELVKLLFETPENFKAGKEQFKLGYIEVWLMETDKAAYDKLVAIRDTAENLDTAFLQFLYTFEPSLPYRFAGQYLIKTPKELSDAINRNATTWEAGKAELFTSFIPVWLATTNHQGISQEWSKVKDQVAGRQDIGLEYFLRLLSPGLKRSSLEVSQPSLSYPKIQSGDVLTTELVFTNTTRGASEAYLDFSKPIVGVALSSGTVFINNASGNNQGRVTLSIDSRVLLKGVHYETVIRATTSEQQKIEIPLSFRIVFPKNAFLKEVAKYAGIAAACFVLLRVIIATAYPGLLNQTFPAFLGWREAAEAKRYIPVFGWTFLLFAVLLYFGVKLLRLKLKRYGKK